MVEKEMRREDIEKAKTIMGRHDPALLSAALSEMMMEADEEADVAKAKEAIKKIYDSISEGKDKKSIMSKAIAELDSDIIEKEVKAIKENLANIGKESLMEAAKNYIDVQEISKSQIYGMSCTYTVGGPLCKCALKQSVGIPCSFFLSCGRPIICNSCGLRYIVGPVRTLSEIDPLIREQLKEEIVQELLQMPELSRAMKKMMKKIQEEK